MAEEVKPDLECLRELFEELELVDADESMREMDLLYRVYAELADLAEHLAWRAQLRPLRQIHGEACKCGYCSRREKERMLLEHFGYGNDITKIG